MDKEIVFKTKVDTGNTVKDINNIDKALKEVNTTVKSNSVNSQKAFEDLNAKVESGTMSMREMTRAVKEYQTIALQAGENSPIGQQAIEQAGELKDRLSDLQQQVVNTGQDGEHLQGALSIGSGVVAGYGAVQSAMALVGSDSKELEKTLVKLTAVTTLLNSVNEIRALFEKQSAAMITINAIKTNVMTFSQYAYTTAVGTTTGAMKLLRLSMLAIPIFAILAGVMALVSAMDLFGDSTEEAAAKQKAFDEMQAKSLKKSQDYLTNNLKTKQDTHDKEIELMKAKGASSDEIYKKEKDNLELTQRNLEKQVTFGIKMNAEQYKLYKDTLQAKKVLEATHQKEISDEQEKGAEDQKKNNEKRKAERIQSEKDKQAKLLELQRLTEDLINANIEDSGLRQLAQLRTQHEREYNDLTVKFGNNQKLIDELTVKQFNETEALKTDLTNQQTEKDKQKLAKENTDAKARLEARILNFRADFEAEQGAKKELADLELEQALQNKELTDGEIEKLHAEHKEKIAEIDKVSAENDLKIKNDRIKAAFEIADATMKSLTSLNDFQNQLDANKLQNIKNVQNEENASLDAKKQSDLSRAGITAEEKQNIENNYLTAKYNNDIKANNANNEIQKKAFNRDKALKIASVSINTAEAVSKSVAASPTTFGAPFSLFSVATGLAQIAAIASTKFDGGNSSITPPTFSSGATNNTNNGGNNNQSTNMNGGFTNTLDSIDTSTGIKVTVVDSEIKAVMDNSKKTNVLSTIGG